MWRKVRHFLSWPRVRALHAMETDRRRVLFSGPVSVRCHGSEGDRADVIGMGVPWLPWRQSVRAVRMLGLPRYTKTDHTPYKTNSPARLQNGERDNNDELSSTILAFVLTCTKNRWPPACWLTLTLMPTSVSYPPFPLCFLFFSDAHTCRRKDLSSGRVRVKGGAGKHRV